MRIILFLTLCFFIGSCSSNNDELVSKRIVIAGKVNNQDPTINKIALYINRIGPRQDQVNPTLDKNGGFKIIFESDIPLDVLLLYKTNFSILIHPGDSIFLEFDGSKEDRNDLFKTLKYSGDAAKINNDAATFQKMYFSSNIYASVISNQNAIKSYNDFKYKQFRDSLKDEEQNLLKKFISDFNPDSEATKWAKIFLDVEYYRDLIAYPDFHRLANNLKRQDWEVPLSYFDFLKDHFSFNDSVLICSFSINGFVNCYSVYLLEKTRNENKQLFNSKDYFKNHPAVMDSLRFYGAIQYTKDPLLKQLVLTEILQQNLEQSNTRMFTKYEREISEIITKPYLREPLFDIYLQTTNNLKNPIQASDAILNKLDGTSIETDIKKILSDNKGKVVYMDCWATWCGPCIAEIPASKKLMKDYNSDDVAFIFICLDSEEKNWKATLSKHSLGGQHYFLTKNQSSDFRNTFNIKGIPHYILFDKNGNIIENGTQRPSLIEDKLENLLTKK
jgi:thiol-disulfide isomerase/thioredoxin